jgi:N-acetylneuraminate synthase
MDRRSEQSAFTPRSGRPTIVAEAGTDHRGDLGRGRTLVEAANEAGAHCIKFQHVYADEILHPRAGTITAGGRSIPIYDRLKAFEQPVDFLAKLFDHARSLGIVPFATPFGLRSARELRAIGAPAVKIASPELNHVPLLREVASGSEPVVLSAGVATLCDIAAALTVLTDHPGASGDSPRTRPIHLLHCVTAYPAPEAEYNLRIIPSLQQILGIPVGVSDHSRDPEVVPAVATALGASMIEKHLTLDRDGKGLDDAVAVIPPEFRRLCNRVVSVAESMNGEGTGESSVLESLRAEFGAPRIESLCGDGIKRLAPSEHALYGRSNRSIHALEAIPAGAVLSLDNCAILRTEQELRPGISPFFWEQVLGARTVRAIPAGEGVVWSDIVQH